MEENKENNENNKNNENKENKENKVNLLSSLFNEYQKNNFRKNNNYRNNNIPNIIELEIKNEDDFSKVIKSKYDKIKDFSISELQNCINKFKSCFNEYENKILNYINEEERKLEESYPGSKSEVLKNLAFQNIFNKIQIISDIYNNIIANIKNNFELLNIFLEQNELIKQKYPFEYFLNKYNTRIYNCSFISKFNLDEIDITKIDGNDYYNHFFNYLKENKKITVNKCVIKKEDKEKEIKYFEENINNIQKLKIIDIDFSLLKKIIDIICERKDEKNSLKKIVLKNFNNLYLKKNNINIEVNLEKIEELKIESGKFSNNIFLFHLFLSQTGNLRSLALKKVRMSNYGLSKLMQIILKFYDSLEYLNLSDNSISVIDFFMFLLDKKGEKRFNQLKYLNFSNNNIYLFNYILMPNIKVIDLTGNNLFKNNTMALFLKDKSKVTFFNNNLFITNCQKNNNQYIEYLNRVLPGLDYELKELNLCFTYNKENQNQLENLKLSPRVKISLIKLDLSYCGLKTDTVIEFMKNNSRLYSLKKLILKYNNIEIDFLKKINRNEIKLDNLQSINLNENTISFDNASEQDESFILYFLDINENLIDFIQKHHNLQQLKLLHTSFFDNLMKSLYSYHDIQGKLGNLYLNLGKYLDENKRKFIFKFDSESYSYIGNKYKEIEKLFSFVS